jgi:hypothetical protein
VDFNLYLAQVVKVDDSTQHPDKTKENRVQIKVPPFTDGWTETHLPWARPLMPGILGGTADTGISSVPPVNSYLWVWFEDENNFKKAYYVFDGRFPDNTLATKFYDDVKPELNKLTDIIPTAPDFQYPDVVSFHYANGICIAYNTNASNAVITTYHPSGSYTIIDNDGNIGVYSTKNVELETQNGVRFYTDGVDTHFVDGNMNKIDTDNQGIIIEDLNTNKDTFSAAKRMIEAIGLLTIKNTTTDLKAEIEEIWTMLDILNTTISTATTTGSPTTHTMVPAPFLALTPQIAAKKAKLATILD